MQSAVGEKDIAKHSQKSAFHSKSLFDGRYSGIIRTRLHAAELKKCGNVIKNVIFYCEGKLQKQCNAIGKPKADRGE